MVPGAGRGPPAQEASGDTAGYSWSSGKPGTTARTPTMAKGVGNHSHPRCNSYPTFRLRSVQGYNVVGVNDLVVEDGVAKSAMDW